MMVFFTALLKFLLLKVLILAHRIISVTLQYECCAILLPIKLKCWNKRNYKSLTFVILWIFYCDCELPQLIRSLYWHGSLSWELSSSQYPGGPCSSYNCHCFGYWQAHPKPVHLERVDRHSFANNPMLPGCLGLNILTEQRGAKSVGLMVSWWKESNKKRFNSFLRKRVKD